MLLAAMLIVLGAAAKNSQYDPSGRTPQFLSKAVKMSQAPQPDVCAVSGISDFPEAELHVCGFVKPVAAPESIAVAANLSTPLLI